MKIAIIGAGFVGLTTGLCFADKGHQVFCVDVDSEKISKINNANPPFFEKGLEPLLKKHVQKNFKATTDLKEAVENSEVTLIAVGTPFDGKEIDLSYVKAVAREIGEALKDVKDYHLVVVKSTVVPGTADNVVLPILEEASGKKAGQDFGVGMNPEFLREGEAVDDFSNPDRIVIGGMDKKSREILEKMYQGFESVDVMRVNNKTAEMIKYTSNSLLATMISFSNEIANLCSKVEDVDVVDVLAGVHLDKRLTPIMSNGERIRPSFISYLESGCGFGGSCFPKDVKALVNYGKNLGLPMAILEKVISVNTDQPFQMLSLLEKHYSDIKGLNVSVMGIAFKPGTDDIRESPALPIIKELASKGANINVFDPIVQDEVNKIFSDFKNIKQANTIEEAISDVDAVLLITRWKEFEEIPKLLKKLGNNPLVIDGRRMLKKNEVERYLGIGLKD
jgi:UDPglucose 6-dehydrogenase